MKLTNYTIRFDPHLRSEARYDNKIIKVGPKFLGLNFGQQLNVLIHEIGHYVSDLLLSNGLAFKWLDYGYYDGNFKNVSVFGINGQTTPGEICAEAYAVLYDEPTFLFQHYPNLYDVLTKFVKREGLEIDKKEAEDLLNFFLESIRG